MSELRRLPVTLDWLRARDSAPLAFPAWPDEAFGLVMVVMDGPQAQAYIINTREQMLTCVRRSEEEPVTRRLWFCIPRSLLPVADQAVS